MVVGGIVVEVGGILVGVGGILVVVGCVDAVAFHDVLVVVVV